MQIIVKHNNQARNHVTYYLYDDSFVNVEAVAKIKLYSKYVKLLYINVNRNYRGNGKGSYLLNRIISDFADITVVVETFKERVAWYQKFGFTLFSNNAGIYTLMRNPYPKKIGVSLIINS